MKRIALLAILVLAPAIALGTTTWTPASSDASRSAKSVATTGTEAAPAAATDGMNLNAVFVLDVMVCAASGQTITDGASLDVYVYDDMVGLWAKSDMTLTVSTGARCGYARGDSPGKGIPILGKRGRIAVVPNGLAVSSGSITIWHLATGAGGAL